MFSPPHMLPRTDDNGAYFLDSSPDHFEVVLNWCRHQSLMVDSGYDLESLGIVAEYFGLQGLLSSVRLRALEEQAKIEEQEKRSRESRERRHQEVLTRLDAILTRLQEGQPRPRLPRL